MTAKGLLATAAVFMLSLWALVLLAKLLRPVVLVPKGGPPMFAACRVDSTGAPRLVWYEVTLDP